MNGPRRVRGYVMSKEESKNAMKSLKRVIKFLFSNFKWYVIFIGISIIFMAAASISSSIFIERIIDTVINPSLIDGFDAHYPTLIFIVITMCVIYGLGILASTLSSQLMARMGQKCLDLIRKQMFNKMETLPIKYFDTHAHGDVMSYYTNDVDTLRQFITQSLPSLFQTILSLIFLVTTMLLYSVWLTLIVFFGATAMILVTKKIGGSSTKYFIKQQQSTGKLEGFIEEMIAGVKVVKVFCHEEEAKKDFDVLNDGLYNDAKKANHYGNIIMPIMGNIGNILYVILAISGTFLVVFNVPNVSLQGIELLKVGVVISFLTMSKQFTMSISQFSQQMGMIAMAAAGATRIFAFVDEESEKDNGYVTLIKAKRDENGNLQETNEPSKIFAWKHPHKDGSVTIEELKGNIVLDNVDFGYDPSKIVLKGVNVYANPGQKVAFVGATGAGKTTITNLINRFYDIADGKIRYDGININKIKKSDLRKSLSVVLQETNLFTGTVKENIRYGNELATDEDVYAAAKIANAYDFITRLPNGFDTMLTGDGTNLSQGQRQLISIARAAVAKCPVMILDEATSSIDTRTEALVQEGTDRLMEGRTVFVIAHRLSTIQNSDVIMVLDHGEIIERGNHESLIAKKGRYYQLYTGAFELE